jgi:hypothetical protein
MPRATPVVEPQGESKVLHEVAAHDEQQLQERLKASPDLLPIEDFRACGSGSLSSATRREAAGGLGREDVGGRSAARPIERRRMFPLGRPRRGDVPRTPSSRRSVRAARYRSWGRPQFLDRGMVCGDRIPAHHPPSWPTLGQLFAAAVPRRAARAGRVRRTRGLAPRGCRAGTGSPLRRRPRTGPSRWHVASEYSTSTMEAATQAALTDREYQTRRGIWLPPRAPLRLGTASPAAPRPGPCSRPRTGRCRGQAAHTAALGGRVKDAARSFGPAFGRP